MDITVTIPDEVAEMAQAQGLTPESYIQSLILRGMPEAGAVLSREARVARMERFVKEISENSENIPRLPDFAFTRESFYSDHD